MQNIWVLSEDGTVLCRKGYDIKLEESLFRKFITALYQIVQEFTDGHLTNFRFNTIRFTVFKKCRFLFVGSTLSKRERKSIRRLEQFVTLFFNRFTFEIIHQWDGNLSLFSAFNEEINRPKAETISEYIESLWGH